MTRVAAIALLLALPIAAQVDPANEAWVSGDTELARTLYEERLGVDPDDTIALHRLALMHAWQNEFDESLALFDQLLRIDPANLEAQIDRARVHAWRGDTDRAVALLHVILAEHPSHLPALQAKAQFASWAGDFGEALRAYDLVIEIAPEVTEARYARAKTLAWADRLAESIASYERILEERPEDVEALTGLAQAHLWNGEADRATEIYRQVASIDPDNPTALRGLARAASWSGDLVEGEARWRRALAVNERDVESLTGLAQTLRWQGRDAAALEVIERALALSPNDSSAREQLRWIEVATRPRVQPSLAHESDSDGNDITTASFGTGWRPRPRLEVRVDGYLRQVSDDLRDGGNAWGATVTGWQQFEPGWAISGTLGAASNDAPGSGTTEILAISLQTPGKYDRVARVGVSRAPLDGTALLLERRVVVDELSAGLSGALPYAIRYRASASLARFDGEVSGVENERWLFSGALTRRLHPRFTLALQGRSFGFDEQVFDGYFSPEFFGLVELAGRWHIERNRWTTRVEIAPGLQRIGEEGDTSNTIRAVLGVDFTARPGRTIGFSVSYSDSGLDSLSPDAGSGDYQYTAFSLTSRWGL